MELHLTKIITSSRFKIGFEEIQTHHSEVCPNFKTINSIRRNPSTIHFALLFLKTNALKPRQNQKP
jgi:hypothetical protein